MKSFNKIFLLSVVAGLTCASVFAMGENKDKREKTTTNEEQMREYREMQSKIDYTLSLDDNVLLNETVPNIFGHPKTTAELWSAIKNLVRLRNTNQRNRHLITNEIITGILEKSGFEINRPIKNLEPAVRDFTLLQIAIINRLEGAANILLMLGADANLSGKSQTDEADEADEDQRPFLARTQGKYGFYPDPKFPTYKGVGNGKTPLEIAIDIQHANIIKALIEKGAKLKDSASCYLLKPENRKFLNELLNDKCLNSSQIRALLNQRNKDNDTQQMLSNYIPPK